MVLDDEEVLEGLDELCEPRGVDTIQPGHVHDLNTAPERFRRAQRLVQHHRAVREEERVGALAKHGSASGRGLGRRQLDRARRRTDREPDCDIVA